MNKWIKEGESYPPKDTKVEVKLANGDVTIGLLNENYYRTAWLAKDKTGMFWRAHVVAWRPLSDDGNAAEKEASEKLAKRRLDIMDEVLKS